MADEGYCMKGLHQLPRIRTSLGFIPVTTYATLGSPPSTNRLPSLRKGLDSASSLRKFHAQYAPSRMMLAFPECTALHFKPWHLSSGNYISTLLAELQSGCTGCLRCLEACSYNVIHIAIYSGLSRLVASLAARLIPWCCFGLSRCAWSTGIPWRPRLQLLRLCHFFPRLSSYPGGRQHGAKRHSHTFIWYLKGRSCDEELCLMWISVLSRTDSRRAGRTLLIQQIPMHTLWSINCHGFRDQL